MYTVHASHCCLSQEKWEKMAKGESTEDDESNTDAAEYFLAGHSTALSVYTHTHYVQPRTQYVVADRRS